MDYVCYRFNKCKFANELKCTTKKISIKNNGDSYMLCGDMNSGLNFVGLKPYIQKGIDPSIVSNLFGKEV